MTPAAGGCALLDGDAPPREFRTLNDRYPLLLFPAFRLQDAMQRVTLGRKQWRLVMEAYNKQRERDEYTRSSGGKKAPPEWCARARARRAVRSVVGRGHRPERRPGRPPSSVARAIDPISRVRGDADGGGRDTGACAGGARHAWGARSCRGSRRYEKWPWKGLRIGFGLAHGGRVNTVYIDSSRPRLKAQNAISR